MQVFFYILTLASLATNLFAGCEICDKFDDFESTIKKESETRTKNIEASIASISHFKMSHLNILECVFYSKKGAQLQELIEKKELLNEQ